MSSSDLHNKVKKGFDRGIITPVQGDYPKLIFGGNTKQGVFKIQDKDKNKKPIKDKEIFYKLYNITDATTGRGEVALFWLFNYKDYKSKTNSIPITLRAEHQGGAKADLNIDKKDVEVKAYNKNFNQASKLGQFIGRDPKNPSPANSEEQKKKLVNIIKALFLVDNLLNNETDKIIDIGNFDIGDLTKAASGMCDVRAKLNDDSTKKMLENIKLFQKLYKRLDALNGMFTGAGLEICITTIGGEAIAAEIIKEIIILVTGEKPGKEGYVANLDPRKFKSSNGVMEVDYIRIKGEPSLDAIKTITEKAKKGQAGTTRKVYFKDNNLFLAFADVFPGN